jgi:hypothetical protein
MQERMPTAATTETIAARLRNFAQEAERNASGRVPMGEARNEPRKPKEPILATYEECLGKLTIEERGELGAPFQS